MSDKSSNKNNAFAKHKAAAIPNNDTANNPSQGGSNMSLTARFLIFVFVPSFTGLTGLGISYLQSRNGGRQEEGEGEGNKEEPHVVDFDRDFVTPFLLSLAFVIVLGFQTNGFSLQSKERKGAFVWPKTRKVQKIRHERVIVEDDEGGSDKKEQ